MGKIRAQLGMTNRITLVAIIAAYYLEDLDDKPRPWNVNNLRRYYY